jgi:ubiquinone/menaquinone biosynthesis C-methylase UbiE
MNSKLDYDKRATAYARHRAAHPEVLRSLLTTAALDRTSRILEVGCGTGNYIVAIAALTGAACRGIDPSREMLAHAQARSDAISFAIGRAERLDFPDASFDLVFSVDVIHHIGDRLAYYREAARVLVPGGKLCTVTDSEWMIRHREPHATYFPETIPVELTRYPPIAILTNLMAQAGFAAITEETVEHPYFVADAQPFRDRAFSSLLLIPEDAFQRGLERLERDLRAGPIHALSRYALIWGTKG